MIGGHVIATCTSFAPAFLNSLTRGPHRIAAYDAVVNHHDPLVQHVFIDDIEFHADAALAQ